MSPKSKKNAKKRTHKRTLPVILLYLAILLFILWLFTYLWLAFLYEPEKNKENGLLDRIYSLSNSETELKKSNNSKTLDEIIEPTIDKVSVDSDLKSSLEPLERDEFQPTMDNLFRERELTIRNIDAIFENIKSPKEISALHSTFGKEVVYIYHTHSRESFLPYLKNTDKPEEAYHSSANITLVGEMLGRALKSRGVGTSINSTDIVQILDSKDLNYNSSYDISGEQVQAARRENNDLEYFIDVHRDSLRKDSTTVEMNGLNYAKLLFVVGTGHEDFEKNLMFAEGLQTMFDTQYPGLSKGIIQKSSSQGNGIYNQDVSPNAIILEIGGVDNTVEELHRSTEVFADVLSNYYWHGEK